MNVITLIEKIENLRAKTSRGNSIQGFSTGKTRKRGQNKTKFSEMPHWFTKGRNLGQFSELAKVTKKISNR